MKTLYLVRGLPGSGKTTYVNAHKKQDDIHVEADMYFVDDYGTYRYVAQKISDAHKFCQHTAFDAMKTGSDVWVSNTFTRRWEMESYINEAKAHGYDVVIKVCTGQYNNVHGVPVQTIDSMQARWEHYTGETYV